MERNDSRASCPEGDDSYESQQHEELLASYLDRLNRGEKIDRDQILAQHPDTESSLFEDIEAFVRLASEGGDASLGSLGDYDLRCEIGRGGMGVVYEAWENSMERAVALKVLPAGIAADPRASTRFMREAQAAGRLNHPNVVPVHAMGVYEHTPYYSMELVEGETLAQILARNKNADLAAETPFGTKNEVAYFARLATTFADVADGLQHAHSRGVVHRDIKPSNLILDSEGRLRILDFGLAKVEGQESLTISGDVVGTPLYMSPEQARRKKIPLDHRTDIYSLGVTMYELLTGGPPFHGKDHADTLSRIIEREPEDPTKINARVPMDFETIILKCLRKDAEDRYGTAEALGQDLRRFARGDAIEAHSMTRLERWSRRVRRRWKVLSVTALAVVFVAAMGVLLLAVASRRHADDVARYHRLVNDGLLKLELGLMPSPGERLEGDIVSLGLMFEGDLWLRPAAWRETIESAVRNFQEAAELFDANPEAHLYLSRGYRALGRMQDAMLALDRSIDRDPNFIPSLFLRAADLRRVGDDELAQEVEEHAVSSVSKYGWAAQWLESHFAFREKRWKDASKILAGLLRSMRNSSEPFAGFETEQRLRRGRAALKADEPLTAAEEFAAIRKEYPELIGPAILLANAYFLLGEDDYAFGTLTEELEMQGERIKPIVAQALKSFGQKARALKVAESIENEGERLLAMASAIQEQGNAEAVSRAGKLVRRAFDLGEFGPEVFYGIAWACLVERDPNRARLLFERLLADRPDLADVIFPELGWVYYYLSDMEKALQISLEYAHIPRARLLSAWSYWRLGKLEESVAAHQAVLADYPRNHFSYYGIGSVRALQGRTNEAIENYFQCVSIEPDHGAWRALRMLYNFENRERFEPYWGEIESLLASGKKPAKSDRMCRQRGFLALSKTYGPQPDLDAALRFANEAVKGAWNVRSEALGYLGNVYEARGEMALAILSLERAVDCSSVWRSTTEDLERLRKSQFPQLLTCASIDAFAKNSSNLGVDDLAQRVDTLGITFGAPGKNLRGYFDAILAERDGRYDAARDNLRKLVAMGVEEEALWIRRASVASRVDETSAACKILETYFQQFVANRSSVAAWSRYAMQMGTAKYHEEVHRVCALAKPSRLLEDLKWTAQSLDQANAIRINCGATKDYVDDRDLTWSSDRFFEGGRYGSFNSPPVGGTAFGRIFLYTRRGGVGNHWLWRGYKILLPGGKYEIVLHFAKTSDSPYPRRFDVIVESEKRITEFDVEAGEFAVPVQRSFEVEVVDGQLDIEISTEHGFSICGIEVMQI